MQKKLPLKKQSTKKQTLLHRLRRIYTYIIHTIDRKPLLSFGVLLFILIVLIVVGSLLRKPAREAASETDSVKTVELFSIGKAPSITYSGSIKKSGVVKIVAQTAGIVQYVSVVEGNRVSRGQVLMGLASTYSGANLPTVYRSIAEQNAQLTEQNLPSQLELIAKRREIAEKSDAQADQLRDISGQSVQSTKDQVSFNEQLLSSLETQINYLDQNNATGSYTAQITQLNQAKSGLLSALSGLKTALRNTEYQIDSDEEPAQLSNLAKDITIKQLEIEERSVKLSKEIALLNLRIAQINESFMYPVSPGAGVVERVYATTGQFVQPGTILATISTDTNVSTLVVPVPKDIAERINRFEPSTVKIHSTQITLLPRYISSEPTEGSLFGVHFTLPQEYELLVKEGERIQVDLPIGQAKSSAAVPYVPIDSVYQTQQDAFVYVASPSADGALRAFGKRVVLGTVFGSFVGVEQGISAEDQIIMNRNILSGDRVSFTQ